MGILDNATWLTGAGGTAVNGTRVISEGGNSTTVTGTFTGVWDASQSGYAVSGFGQYGVSTPQSATFAFSTPVDNLTFSLEHVNSSGTSHDDMWTIYAYDQFGVLLPGSTVIASLSGLVDELVYINPDGSVFITIQNHSSSKQGIIITASYFKPLLFITNISLNNKQSPCSFFI